MEQVGEASSGLGPIGIVVIGRNEAERLPLCLASMPSGVPICYVDSGSTDDSRGIAARAGVDVHLLSSDVPFTAARARNAGFEVLIAGHPGLEQVFFIDGDCVLRPEFLPQALATMRATENCAIVVGALEESNQGSNVFGLLAGLEWQQPRTGEITNFDELGGIMLVRCAAFRAAGGFDASFIAGEDPELGVRLHLAGQRTFRIAAPMAVHAMEMQRFGQWWRRSVRSGHALAQRFAKHGRSVVRDCRGAVRSTVAYGIGIPLLALVGLVLFGPLGLVPLLAFVFLWARFYRYYRGKGAGPRPAAVGASFGVIAKIANAVGLVRFCLQRSRGQFRLIEYK